MKETRIASRYAKSLIALAIDRGELEIAYEDMKLIAVTCSACKELEIFLKSPIVIAEKKIIILREVFKGKISRLSMDFITLIASRRRENYLNDIAVEFLNQYKLHKNIVTAVVTTACGIDDDLRTAIQNTVEKNFKAQVELLEKENRDLIGGLILRVGDKQFDGSLKRKLKDLDKKFSEKYFMAN